MESRSVIAAGIVTLIFFPILAGAQVRTGVIVGPNFSSAKVVDNLGDMLEVEGQTEFGAGLTVEKVFTQNLSMGANLLYLRKGVRVTTVENLGFDVWAAYLEVPLFLKYSFGEKIRPYISFGPTVGLLLKSEADVDLLGLVFNGDFSTVLQNMDYGLFIGGGIEIPVWKGSLLIEGRYAYGLYDIIKGGVVEMKAGKTLRQEATVDPGDELYTRGIQIMLGFSYPL
jgi:hypothetical protein